HAQQRRFAATGRAEQHAEFTNVTASGRKCVFHVKVDIFQRLNPLALRRVEGAREILDSNLGPFSFHRSPPSFGLRPLRPSFPYSLLSASRGTRLSPVA